MVKNWKGQTATPILDSIYQPSLGRLFFHPLRSVSLSGADPEEADKLEEEIRHQVPEVASQFRAGDEESPDEDQEESVEGPSEVTEHF